MKNWARRYTASWEKTLESPVRDTVWARRLAELETPDGYLKIFRVGQLAFAGRGQEVRFQRHVNHLNNCRNRRNCHKLKLSLQIVGKGFEFLSPREGFSLT